jgi:hypothetical protein
MQQHLAAAGRACKATGSNGSFTDRYTGRYTDRDTDRYADRYADRCSGRCAAAGSSPAAPELRRRSAAAALGSVRAPPVTLHSQTTASLPGAMPRPRPNARRSAANSGGGGGGEGAAAAACVASLSATPLRSSRGVVKSEWGAVGVPTLSAFAPSDKVRIARALRSRSYAQRHAANVILLDTFQLI